MKVQPNQPRRIQFLVSGLGGGGYQRQLYYLLEQFQYRGIEIAVCVWRFSEEATWLAPIKALGVQVFNVDSARGFSGRMMNLRRAIRTFQPEFIHSYAFPSNFPVWMGSRGICPAIGSLRNAYWEERKAVGSKRGALCCKFPGLLIANSMAAKVSALDDSTFFAPRKVAYVGNGMDLSSFSVEALPPFDRLELIGVGRLWSQKNWPRALAMLKTFEDSADINWRFRLFGDGPLKGEIESLIAKLKLGDRVQLMGFTKDIAKEISRSHVLISCSDYEGTSNSIMEAMACGRPVICTPAGDNTTLIRHGENGYLFGFDGFSEACDTLCELASQPAHASKLGVQSRARAEKLFDLNRLADETLAAYQHLTQPAFESKVIAQ